MLNFFKRYWFYIGLSFFAVFYLLCMVLIAIGPHDDAEGRGFSQCTYDMAQEFAYNQNIKTFDILKTITQSYVCYFAVLKEGMQLYLSGKQKTPWANYLFEPEIIEKMDKDFINEDKELPDENLLNDDSTTIEQLEEGDSDE